MISEKRSDHSLLFEAAQELARRTGGVALRHFRSALAVEKKTDGSPVTIADRSAEQTAREWISRRFPDDGILGEEFGALLPSRKAPVAHRSHRWNEDIRARRATLGDTDRRL